MTLTDHKPESNAVRTSHDHLSPKGVQQLFVHMAETAVAQRQQDSSTEEGQLLEQTKAKMNQCASLWHSTFSVAQPSVMRSRCKACAMHH